MRTFVHINEIRSIITQMAAVDFDHYTDADRGVAGQLADNLRSLAYAASVECYTNLTAEERAILPEAQAAYVELATLRGWDGDATVQYHTGKDFWVAGDRFLGSTLREALHFMREDIATLKARVGQG